MTLSLFRFSLIASSFLSSAAHAGYLCVDLINRDVDVARREPMSLEVKNVRKDTKVYADQKTQAKNNAAQPIDGAPASPDPASATPAPAAPSASDAPIAAALPAADLAPAPAAAAPTTAAQTQPQSQTDPKVKTFVMKYGDSPIDFAPMKGFGVSLRWPTFTERDLSQAETTAQALDEDWTTADTNWDLTLTGTLTFKGKTITLPAQELKMPKLGSIKIIMMKPSANAPEGVFNLICDWQNPAKEGISTIRMFGRDPSKIKQQVGKMVQTKQAAPSYAN